MQSSACLRMHVPAVQVIYEFAGAVGTNINASNHSQELTNHISHMQTHKPTLGLVRRWGYNKVCTFSNTSVIVVYKPLLISCVLGLDIQLIISYAPPSFYPPILL